jgi:hypothetical protein
MIILLALLFRLGIPLLVLARKWRVYPVGPDARSKAEPWNARPERLCLAEGPRGCAGK